MKQRKLKDTGADLQEDDAKKRNSSEALISRYLNFVDAPKWCRDNEFIHKGYRKGPSTVKECLRSIFGIHNEAFNIWSHGLGSIVFIFISIHSVWWLWQHEPIHTVLFLTFTIAATMCMLFSAMFHVLHCHSPKTYQLFARLDYSGISIMIAGSMLPILYYGFACDPFLRNLYSAVVLAFASICIALTLGPGLHGARYRVFRSLMFVTFGLSGAVPFFHRFYTYGYSTPEGSRSMAFPKCALMGTLYVSGAALYATRIPERLAPGRFDYLGSSHQWLHVCVVLAALVHHQAVLDVFQFRNDHPCPASV